ncbi:hypothetical protein KPH14_011660 [Odynerus spinipes]|uniref:E3 SUMO-protein ligase RanBP2 n=1 Tax=Odynerus spinipes TaxID=1348599 RepID=A0AAD9RFF8_9HYME|nr:hypothetical protein KPH14_011660 [Odynerus spinipes]
MFRSKKDVDRHVKDIFRKLKNDNEKAFRCYNIAKLYYQVGDYESAKRYVSSYLEVRGKSAGAHKLLGQILEALGEKEAALNQYELSLELDGNQNGLVLKVCELLVDMDIGMNVNHIKYWVKRADKQFPHHSVVFQLKEKMLTIERPNDSSEDLEALIASELSIRPTDVNLRVKLIKYYMAKQRFNDAYNHAANVETTYCHRNSLVWYQSLSELLIKCKDSRLNDWSFWIFYISTLERYTALSLKEHGNDVINTVPEATQALFNFDQALTEFKSRNFSYYPIYTEEMLTHMWGQLHFHLGCLFLRKTKREQGSWDDASRLCAALFLTALHVHPIDPKASWVTHVKDQFKNLVSVWYREGSYRCSQTGHVLQDCAKNNAKKLMSKIDTFFFTEASREKIYQRIFVSRLYQQYMATSYFCNYTARNPPLRLCVPNELKHYDEVSEEVWPDSLHHHVWLGVVNRLQSLQNKDKTYPQQYSHVFPELQFSVYNLNQLAPDTLCRLDIDAFLNAAVLCSSTIIEEQQQRGFLTQERLPTLPADLTNSLSTSAQEKWWSYAYKMYSKQGTLEGDIGEIRQELRRGLEVIRCIGNHGLHPVVLVHLARLFHHRVKILKEKDPEHPDISALENRCEHYWSTVIPLLERLQNNQTLRITSSKLFNYEGKDMSNAELTNALEEGRLLMAQRFVRSKQYEQAIDALQVLRCPEASFQQGQIYKILADEIVSSMPRESLTSEMRSQHIIMLSKARNCFYLTLDRLRSPGTNPKHPLNSELCTHISDIENELKRIDPDLSQGELSRNDCDGLSDESYSPAHSGVDQPITNAPMSTLTGLGTSVNILSTPQRNTHRTPKQSSTPCRPQHQDIMDLSRNRTEARPSPERLDAQIRQMMHARDNVMQTIIEQNKTIIEKIDELTKEMAELRKDSQKQRVQSVNFNPNLEDDLYVLGEEDYGDMNYTANQSAPASSISGNVFPPSHRHPYSSLVYPPATAFQGYYQGTIPFTDPNAQAMPPLYPPNVYPMPVLYSNRPKVPDNMLQQGLFAASRLPTQLTDLMPPVTNTPLQMPMQKVEVTKPQTIIKDTSTKKSPPVNVVITTSDTLPTTAPLVQPTLSVTIPAQYRMGSTSAVTTTTESQNVPHCYQISMPSQATIPTTVNLPPLPATLTSTPANISLSETPKSNNLEIRAASSPNNSAELHEPEHDPIPDFVPVIPLPAEVKVTTGEEDEVTLYCARAKLFRFVDKEWKERGVGNVKLLRNTEGKVRLLMRRDQVLKICANHMLRPDMELTRMPNNDKAWIWVANDFADEQVKLEKLCIKFKTVDEAQSFKKHFDNARSSLTSVNETVSSETDKVITTVKPSEGEKNYPSSIVSSTITSSIPSDKEKTTAATAVVGGFSFITKPIIQTVSPGTENTSRSQSETQKSSPFTGFTFNKPDFTKVSEVTTSSGFSFLKPTTTTSSPYTETSTSAAVSKRDVTAVITSLATTIVPTTSASRVSLRRPHTPAPAQAALASDITQKSEIYDQMEGETEIVFEHKATLQQQNKNTKKWENRCTGQMKIIVNIRTGHLNLVMHREEDSKVCYNQDVSAEMKFNFKTGNKNIINWILRDDKEENKFESYSIIFKTPEQASKFYDIVMHEQQKKNKDNTSIDTIRYENRKALEVSNTSHSVTAEKKQVPLSELFKPAAGSWECKACYTRNDGKQSKCVACGESSPFITSDAVAGTVASMGPSQKVPLSQLFKKPSGSWECKGCYISNLGINNYCIACDTPKDPSMPPKPKTNNFGLAAVSSESKPTFTFGIPQESAKDTTSGFTFRMSKPVEGAADEFANKAQPIAGEKSNTDIKSIFGGTQQQTIPSKDAQFTFGSYGKPFSFNIAKSPPRSPGACETSDEEVVESDDIHFSPIIPTPDKIEVKTGEEDEEVLYSHRAKLFRYDSTAKEWKERGIGDIKLLRHYETKKLRLIMRRDQVLKLCLNHFVLPETEFKSKDEKTWLWNAADYSEGEIEYMQFACRFKTSEIASDFKKAVDNAKRDEKKSLDNGIVQNEQIQECGKSSQDIEVVYELKVTPEEKAAALKLQLPVNFYAYKQKEDCPGCLGCRESSTPPLKDMQPQEELKTNGILTSAVPTSTLATCTNVNSNLDDTKTSDHANGKVQINVSTGISFATKSDNSETKSTTTTKSSTFTTPSIFDSSLSFGYNKSNTLNDKESTDFIFGVLPSQMSLNEKLITSGSTEDQNNALSKWFGNSNVKICEPVGTNQQSASASLSGSTSFPTSGTNIFIKEQFSFSNKSTGSIFGNAAKTASQSTFGNVGNQIFGGSSATTDEALVKSPFSNTTESNSSSVTGFGGTSPFFTNLRFSTAGSTPLFGNSITTTTNVTTSDSKLLEEDIAKKDENTGFLRSSNLTFSTLAQKGPQTEAFKKDPNFSFAGAGSSVFGSSKTTSTVPNPFTMTQTKQEQSNADKKEDNDEDEGNDDENDQEHDPHFEPIVPLPDAIEVRTGEEDEEKVFCKRAKLYRYDNATKEWKERGVGDMKILHHAKYGSYRLLLRRDQVHKVVCNFLIKPDIEFRALSTSDRAWMWAGMNHAEETPCVEELAVKFKTPELAAQFKEIIDEVQQTLCEKQSEQDVKWNSENVQEEQDQECIDKIDDETYDQDDDGEINDQEDVDDEESDEGNDDEDENSLIFEEQAMLLEKLNGGTKWITIGAGTLEVHYDSSIFSEKIILKADESGEIMSNTVISMDAEMKLDGKKCIWTAIDHALKPPASRTLKAIFSSSQLAKQMHKAYLYGLLGAKRAGISEQGYEM